VVLTPRCWRQAGDDAHASRRPWWQQSPVHQGERGVSRKTIAQGMFWHKNALNINALRVLCRRLCRDPQKLLLAVKNFSSGR
jgi:hypothetical protein